MNKVAVVVGGGQTLGEYISKGLGENGYDVAVLDLNGENAVKVAADIEKEYSVRAKGYKIDATNENDVVSVFQNLKNDFGTIDLMVYSAGVAKSEKITDFELKDFEFTMSVNTTGFFLCSRETSKIMIEKNSKGCILYINSKSGKVGSKHNSAYSASKFAGVGLTQSLALDLAEHQIRVNSLMLGNLLKSPMFQSLIPQYAKKLGIPVEEVEQVYIDKVPLKRGCEYKDVLNAILFYGSDKAEYMTGQSINITGGQVMF